MWEPEQGVTLHENAYGHKRINSATPSTVRDVNKSIILNLVRLHQPISRVELSNRTGIFRSSVSAIADELLQEGLLVEKRAMPKGRGRVPVHLFVNPQGFRVAGVSVRRFETRVAASGLTGKLDATVSFPTPADPVVLLKHVAKAIERLRPLAGGGFREVGISVPGMVSADSGQILLLPSLPEYAGFPIAREVSALAGAPATAENDCNVGALAELWFNEREVAGVRDLAFVEAGDVGVGAALIFNGELYRGHDRTWVGEFGHMVIDPSGPRCNCGRRGCWELYVCDRATWHRYDREKQFTPARFDNLVQLTNNGDRRAVQAFRETAEYLSLGLSNIMFGLNPQRIVLAGEVIKVWSRVQKTLESVYSASKMALRVYPARFSPDVLSLQGAIVLALRKVFASPKLG